MRKKERRDRDRDLVDDVAPCGECFALVRDCDIDRHMEWHRYSAPVRRAGPLIDEQRRDAEA